MKKRRIESGKARKALIYFGSPKVPISSIKNQPQHEKLSDWQHAS